MTLTMTLLTTILYLLWTWPPIELPDPMVPVPPSWFIPVDRLNFSS
jgi:hypothetical protein